MLISDVSQKSGRLWQNEMTGTNWYDCIYSGGEGVISKEEGRFGYSPDRKS